VGKGLEGGEEIYILIRNVDGLRKKLFSVHGCGRIGCGYPDVGVGCWWVVAPHTPYPNSKN
jgi:hypothetical protein